jgi:hypothetical protein
MTYKKLTLLLLYFLYYKQINISIKNFKIKKNSGAICDNSNIYFKILNNIFLK